MRCFLGCDLSANVKMGLDSWRDKALRINGSYQPVKPANFHITTWFLGTVTNPQLDSLVSYIETNMSSSSMGSSNINLSNIAPFKLTLDDIVCWNKPKLVAAIPSVIPEQLNALNGFCKHASSAANINASGNFDTYRPHVTLARKVPADWVAPPLFTPNIELSINQLHLFESLSGNNGVQYIPRFSFSLPSQLSVREQLKQGSMP